MSKGSLDRCEEVQTSQWNRTILTKGFLAFSVGLLFFGAYAVPSQDQKKTNGKDLTGLFESKVRPVLLAKCYACHGPNQQIANLRFDKPISAEQARMVVEAITYKGETKMPPSGKLPADEMAALSVWAKAGAPWPSTPKNTPKTKAPFWSFTAPKSPDLPTVKAKWWAHNPLDTFILAKLEEKGLKPAPPADRRTLIRRATFDLTGLPPTPQEVEAFLADKQPNAFERVVDRLLASPAYGERWGRYWLDVARYADSNGLDENLVYPYAWRYRDWVIQSLNQDKPINRFFQEQIAGDLLPDAGDSGIIATGYLSLGAKMLAEDDPVKQELDVIDEQVDTFSKTFLALTVGCARCHDHKFDPITSKDYYSMAGIFKSTKTMVSYKNMAEWIERPLGAQEEQKKFLEIEAQIKSKTEASNKKFEAAAEALLKTIRPQKPEYEKAAKKLLAIEANATELKAVIESPSGAAPSGAQVLEAEDYVTGNVNKEKDGFGKGIGVLVNRGEYPNRTEYKVTVPAAGPYQLDLRYASGEPRSIRVYANGSLVLSNAAGKASGGYNPEHQKWFAEGIVMLKSGENTIRFERDSYFPHIDKLLLIARPGQQPTENLEAIAREANLIPEIVRDVADRIKKKIDVTIELPEKPIHLFPAETAAELKKLEAEITDLKKSKPDLPKVMSVFEGSPTNLKVHIRGSYLTLGDECPRRFPAIVSQPGQSPIPAGSSGRLELANWLTDPKNPLTARVFVNRIWRWRFGRGLVGSVDNFGALGDLPTHPELLDWLALSFVKDDKWSLKKFHKRLMLTNTYLMSGQYDKAAADLDPDNRLLWRFPRKRLEAEAIRDSILFVTGTLDQKLGGSLINLAPRSYVTSTANADPVKYDSLRRAVYLPVIRSALYDVYAAFDFGDPTVMNGDRASTTITPQALFMLNSPVVLNATKAKAEAMLKQSNWDDSQRIRQLYLTCYGRPATNEEVTRSLEFLSKFMSVYAKSANPKLSAWQSLCKSIIAANEFIYVE